MSESVKQAGDGQNDGLVRGGLVFLTGLVLCGVALMAQTALLEAVAGKKSS